MNPEDFFVSISGISGRSSAPDPTTDPKFQKLEKEIAEWRCCATTPPREKDTKVQELRGEQAALKSSIEQKAAADAQLKADTGKGSLIDISA